MQNQTSSLAFPLVLTFGVADPAGALGIQADLATFFALGCHGLSVMTGMLVADSARIEDCQEIDADWMCDQARVLLEDMQVAAIKVGALLTIEQASVIAEIVSDYPDVPLILDPFLSSLPDSGLADDDMLGAIRQILVPQAHLLLLSQVELARMAETWRDGAEALEAAGDAADAAGDDAAGDDAAGDDEQGDDDELDDDKPDDDNVPGDDEPGDDDEPDDGSERDQDGAPGGWPPRRSGRARALEPGSAQHHAAAPVSALAADVAELTGSGCAMVLVTCTGSGKHGARSNTLFDDSGEIARFEWQHLAGPFSGAGSTMSAAIAAYLAHGMSPRDAAAAQSFTSGALAHAQRIGMGKLVPNKFFQAAPFTVPPSPAPSTPGAA